MRKILWVMLLTVAFLAAHGQDTVNRRLPFVLLIDSDVPNPSVTTGVFMIKDSLGIKIDSVIFKYEIGALKMSEVEFNKLFKIRYPKQVFIKFICKNWDGDNTTEYVYEKQIPNKYMNWEYPQGFMNKAYFIVKVFNKSNRYSRLKYYFEKREKYIVQIQIPGLSTTPVILKEYKD